MLTVEQMMSLKRGNVSKDTEKTKQRVKDDFMAASRSKRKALEEMSGLTRASIHRAYKTGSLNARLALSLAIVLNVTPHYYTGEQDIRQPLQDAFIYLFLQKLGYKKLLKEMGVKEERPRPPRASQPQRPRRESPAIRQVKDIEEKTVKSAVISQNAKVPETVYIPDPEELPPVPSGTGDAYAVNLRLPNTPDMRTAVAELSEEGAVVLLRALLERAKAGGDARKMAEIVKRCLLT